MKRGRWKRQHWSSYELSSMLLHCEPIKEKAAFHCEEMALAELHNMTWST